MRRRLALAFRLGHPAVRIVAALVLAAALVVEAGLDSARVAAALFIAAGLRVMYVRWPRARPPKPRFISLWVLGIALILTTLTNIGEIQAKIDEGNKKAKAAGVAEPEKASPAFTRLYKGFDPRVPQRLAAAGMDEDALDALLEDLEVPVIFDAMPVQDAIDFCCWALETTIGWASFHIGSATCGYPLQVATILADVGFTWVAKPELRLPSRN